MASNGAVRGQMRPSHGRSPSFIIIGLFVVIAILGFNYWTTSSRNSDLQNELADVQEQSRVLSMQKSSMEKRNDDAIVRIRECVENLSNSKLVNEKRDQECQALSEQFKYKEKEVSDAKKDLLVQKDNMERCVENGTRLMEELDFIKKEKDTLNENIYQLQEQLQNAKNEFALLISHCKQDNTASNIHPKQNDNLPIQTNDANVNPNNIPDGIKGNNIPQPPNDDANNNIAANPRNEMRDQPAVLNKPTIPLEVNIIQKNDVMKNQENPPQFNNNFPFVRPNNMNQQEDEFDHNRNRLQSLEKEPNPLGDNVVKPPQIIVMDKPNDHDDKNGEKPVESVPVGDLNQPDNYDDEEDDEDKKDYEERI